MAVLEALAAAAGADVVAADAGKVEALRPPEWRLDREAIEAAISPKTSAILFNNPHNPAGRLFGRNELDVLAHNEDLAARYGKSLLALFTRGRDLLSAAAFDACQRQLG